MRRINLPLILDTALAAACAFLLFFTAIRYYTGNVYLALGFALCALALFGALAYLYVSKKQNKKLLISGTEKKKKLLALHLSLSSDEYVWQLFLKCLNADEDCLKGGKIVLENEIYFFNFRMAPLTEDDVAKIIKYSSQAKKILLCCAISPEAALLAENFDIDCRNIDKVYDALEKKRLLPEKYAYEKQKAGVFKLIKSRFTRKLSAPLFWSGAALLFLSYFTFYPVYYIVSGGIMLILAVVTLAINQS